MVCFPFKCFPCLKAFEGGKLICALVLLIVGAMMIVQEPNVINCNKFTAQCPTAFNKNAPANKAVMAWVQNGTQNAIQSYCSCISSCMNWFLVYGENKTSTDKNNCFAWSIAAGVKGNSTPSMRANNGEGSKSLAGVTGQGTCSSCEDIAGYESKIFRVLGGIALMCALGLAVSVTCEVKGVKIGNKCFSLCTLGTDWCVIVLLAVATGIAGVGWFAATIACDPDKLSKELTKAADASTDNKDNGAAMFQFLIDLMAPLASGLCGQRKKFFVYALSSSFAETFTWLTVIATCCICCKCTKDGKDKGDHKAKEMQKLMYESDSDVE